MSSPAVQRALISVSDKTGLAEFAQELVAKGVEIFSTGGTENTSKLPALRFEMSPSTPAFPR